MAKKILIADDSEHSRKLLRFFLEREGYKIIQARDGEEALEKIRSESPHLMIIDIVMPNVDGISLLLQLKEEKIVEKIPIIVVSGKGGLHDLFLLNEIPIKAFMEKPFPPEELVKKVKNILG